MARRPANQLQRCGTKERNSQKDFGLRVSSGGRVWERITMITIRNFLETTRALLTSPRALAIFAALYALLLATLYWYIATREATVWQVFITLAGLLVIPAEFFILQAAIMDQARDQRFRWRAILIDSLKIFIVTIPIFIIASVLWYLLNKWQAHHPGPPSVVLFR